MTILRDDFAIVTSKGVTTHTFSDRALAVAHVKASGIPGLTVEQVTLIEHRRRVYRPRPAKVFSLSNSIPQGA